LWPRNQANESDSVRILQVRVDWCHDNSGFDRDQVDTDERNPNPGIDYDTFVQYPVKHVNKAGSAWYPFDRHAIPSSAALKQLTFSPSPPRYSGLAPRYAKIPARHSSPAPGCSSLSFLYARKHRRLHSQVRIILPPIEPYFFSLIDGTHQQPDSDSQQFDVCQRDTHVARDHQSLVENTIQNIDQIRSSRNCRHSIHGGLFFLPKRCKNTRSARLMLNASATACQRMENEAESRWCRKLRRAWDSRPLVIVAWVAEDILP
jgi:hypothetical protein